MLASCLAAELTSIRALLATDSHGLHKPPGPTAKTAPEMPRLRWTARNGSERQRSAPCQPTRHSWFVPKPRCCRGKKNCPSLVFLPSSAALFSPSERAHHCARSRYYIRARTSSSRTKEPLLRGASGGATDAPAPEQVNNYLRVSFKPIACRFLM